MRKGSIMKRKHLFGTAPACNTGQSARTVPGPDPWFFDLPTQQRGQTLIGQTMIADSRSLFAFAAEGESSYDLFPKHWCRHAALIVMKRALVKTEPIYRLSDESFNKRGC